MAKAEYLVMAAGGVSLAGGFAEENGWPSNGVNVVAATGILTLLASATENSRAGKIVNALAWLMLISAVYATVPALQRGASKAKIKPLGNPKRGEDRGSYIAAHPQPHPKGKGNG